MPLCPHCAQEADFEENGGELNCTLCGAVVEGQHFSSDVTFTKGADGESAAVGQYVSGGGTGPSRIAAGKIYNQVDSHERSLAKGRDEIEHLVLQLEMRYPADTTEGAHRLYRIGLAHNFTRGRRTAQVAGACLYIYCRQEQQPFMLIDISDILGINVFVLGSVFLQLCRVLRLEAHPMFSRPIDPSMYIHRFTYKLLGTSDKNKQQRLAITNTALRLVKSMKRDWMQTGRRPSGICGAALFIAVHLHGLEFTSREIVSKIHIGEATLAKRVSEFATTSAGALTMTEFDTRSREMEIEQMALLENTPPAEESSDPGCHCVHIEMGDSVYQSGMCLNCYKEYLENTGGQAEGHNPPAYTRGLIKAAKASEAEAEAGEEEEQQEILALPAPDDCPEGMDVEAEMHAAIASAELTPYAKAYLPEKELRRSTRAASQAAAQAAAVRQQQALPHQQAHADTQQPPLTDPSEQATGTQFGPNQLPSAQQSSGPEVNEQGPEQATAHEQSSDQQLALVPEEEEDGQQEPVLAIEGGSAEAAPAEAIIPVEETLSDMDMDMEEFIVRDDVELKTKTEMWDTINKDWIEAQELKKAQLEEAHQARTEKMAEEEAKEAEGGRKRGRGRPLGSKTKPKPEDNLGPSDTPQEAVAKLLHAKKLTSKVDYQNLDRLLDNPAETAEPAKKRKVGDAIQERERRQADVAAQKRARQQQALAADKSKQRSGSGSLMGLGGSGLGPGLRSGSGKSSNLFMLGRFRQKQDQPTSPGRFRPTSPTAAGR